MRTYLKLLVIQSFPLTLLLFFVFLPDHLSVIYLWSIVLHKNTATEDLSFDPFNTVENVHSVLHSQQHNCLFFLFFFSLSAQCENKSSYSLCN